MKKHPDADRLEALNADFTKLVKKYGFEFALIIDQNNSTPFLFKGFATEKAHKKVLLMVFDTAAKCPCCGEPVCVDPASQNHSNYQ